MINILIGLIYIIVSVLNPFCTYAKYVPSTIKEDNTQPEDNEEFYTNDSTAFTRQLEYEFRMRDNWDSLSDEDKEKLSDVYGVNAADVGASLTSKGGKNKETCPVAAVFDSIDSFLTPNVLDNDICGQYEYSKNIYEVRDKEWKNFHDKYTSVGAHFLKDEQYKLIYEACKYLKWDFCALVGKWNYQSAHCYILEKTSWGPALGYAGQLAGESNHITVIKNTFTQEEIAKGKGWTRVDGMKNPPLVAGVFGTWMSPETVKKNIDSVGWNSPEIEFLCSDTGDENLERIKLNLVAMIEMRLVVSVVSEKGHTSSLANKEGTKLREIAEKSSWSEDDMEYLFGDLLSDDSIYKKFDSLPKYKQKAYIFFKHWSAGTSDSGQPHITIKEICDYIENGEFNKDLAKKYISTTLATHIREGIKNNGYQPTKDLAKAASDLYDKKVPFYNLKHWWIAGYDLVEVNKLIDSEKNYTLDLEQAAKVVDSIDESVFENDLAKAVLFVMSGFIEGSNPKLDPLAQDVHGLFHAGAMYQLKFMGQRSLGASGVIWGQESVVLYFPALDWYLFDYEMRKTSVP